jgi:serine/threonine-protein kinase 24/25/MST4
LWDFGTVRHVGGQATIGRSQNKSNVQPQDDLLTWSGTRRADIVSDTPSDASSTLVASALGVRRGSTDTSTIASSIVAKGDLPPVPVKPSTKYDNEATLKHGLSNGMPETKAKVAIQREPSDEYDDYDDDYQEAQLDNGDTNEDLPSTSILDSVVLPALASVSFLPSSSSNVLFILRVSSSPVCPHKKLE